MKVFNFISPREVDSHEGFNPGGVPYIVLPDSTVLQSDRPLYVPDFSETFVARPMIGLKICRLGKSIAERFANRYIGEFAPCLSIMAADSEEFLKPYLEPCHDNAVVVGTFTEVQSPQTALPEIESTAYRLFFQTNFSTLKGIGFEKTLMVPPKEEIESAVSLISKHNTLKTGDLLLLPLVDPEETHKPDIAHKLHHQTIKEGDEIKMYAEDSPSDSKPLLITRFK